MLRLELKYHSSIEWRATAQNCMAPRPVIDDDRFCVDGHDEQVRGVGKQVVHHKERVKSGFRRQKHVGIADKRAIKASETHRQIFPRLHHG